MQLATGVLDVLEFPLEERVALLQLGELLERERIDRPHEAQLTLQLAHPLGRALALTRELRTPDAKTARIVLRGGVYRLAETLTLGPEDSGMIIEAAPGETPVVSGGRVVTVWKPWKGALLQADLAGLKLPD